MIEHKYLCDSPEQQPTHTLRTGPDSFSKTLCKNTWWWIKHGNQAILTATYSVLLKSSTYPHSLLILLSVVYKTGTCACCYHITYFTPLEFLVFMCMLRVLYWYKWIYLFLNISELWEIIRVTFKCTNLYHLQNPLKLTHKPAFQHARSASLHYFLFLLKAALFKWLLRTQLRPQAESILRCC